MTDVDIFLNAPAGATPGELAAYLEEACGGDAALRQRVEALFAADGGAGGFMGRAPVENETLPDGAPLTGEGPGDVIGNYKLLQQIGVGGFGVVYMAEQLRPVKRRVALKIIKLGMDTKQVVARFEAERQALAMMDHPNIAKVHDAGATETGRPYFVMELVRGVPITEFCDEHCLSTEGRLGLFVAVCQAVQHAHQKGVIHRDLKPSNVMITMHDDQAVPKVIDFGVAKATQMELTEKTLFTNYEQFIGTPAYMSPEQAQLSGLDIDTRSDIYALGVLLYELLTGTTPFDARELAKAGMDEVRRVIREEEPPRMSTRLSTMDGVALTSLAKHRSLDPDKLSSLLRGDLEWIAMKALEKDRTRRYETANGLAEDIRRHLADEPVSAVAPSPAYRLAKYVRRHRAGLGVAAVIAILLVAGTAVSSWMAIKAGRAEAEATDQALKATEAEGVATRAEKEAVEGEMVARLQFAEQLLSSGEPGWGVALLAQLVRQDLDHPVARGRLLSALTQREWQYQVGATARVKESTLSAACFSPDGSKFAIGDLAGYIRVFDTATGQPWDLPEMRASKTAVYLRGLAFSPDGRSLAAAGWDELAVWNVETGVRRFSLARNGHQAFSFVTFSPDSQWILTGGGTSEATVVNASNGELLGGDEGGWQMKHGSFVFTGQFGPDGRLAVTGCHDGLVRLWDIDPVGGAIALRAELPHEGVVWSVKLSRDGRRLVAGVQDGTAEVWSIPDFRSDPEAKPERLGMPIRHAGRVHYAEFSPDPQGELVVTASYDGTARVWDSQTGEPVGAPLEHARQVTRATFNHDGSRIVTGSLDGRAQVWDVQSGRKLGEPFRHEAVVEVEFDPRDGRRILTAGYEGVARVWEARQGQLRSRIYRHEIEPGYTNGGGEVPRAEFSPDGSLLLTGAMDGVVRLWDVRTGWPAVDIAHGGAIRSLRISRDGRRAVTVSTGGLGIWNFKTIADDEGRQHVSATSTEIPGVQASEANFSCDPRGDRLVTVAHWSPIAQLWDSETGILLREFRHPSPNGEGVMGAAFTPDGNWVVTASEDGGVRMWRTDSEGEPVLLGRHAGSIAGGDISVDGAWIATAGRDHKVRIWDARDPTDETREREVHVLEHAARVHAVAFSPDSGGQLLLATGAGDGTAQTWDATSGAKVGVAMRHTNRVNSIRFSPDGRRIVTAAGDRTARIWDVASGLPLSEPLNHEDACLFAEFSPDGRRVVTTGMDATARVWDVPPAGTRAPEWLADWAEAAVGIRLDEGGMAEPLTWEERNSIQPRLGSFPEDDYRRWAEWYYAPHTSRPLSPFTDFGRDEYLAQRLAEASESSLEEAARVSRHSSGELGRMAKRVGKIALGSMQPSEAQRAEELAVLSELISLSNELVGGETMATLTLRQSHAAILRQSGRLGEARAELEELLKLCEKLAPNAKRKSIELCGELAALEWEAREAENEIAIRRQLTERTADVFGPESYECLASQESLAERLHALDRRDESIELKLRVIALKRRILGPVNPGTLDSLADLGRRFRAMKRYEEAIDIWQEILDRRTEALGQHHGFTLRAMRNMAWTLREAKRFDEALELSERLVPLCEESLGSEHEVTLLAKIEEAHSLHGLERFEEAIQKRNAIIESRKSLGEADRHTLRVRLRLSDSLTRVGEHEQALAIRQEVARLRLKSRGSDHSDTIEAVERVTQSLSALGRLDSLRERFEEELARQRNRQEPDLRELEALIAAVHTTGRIEEALEMQLPLAEIPGLDGSARLVALRKIARYAVAIGNWEVGKKALERARASATPREGEEHSMAETRLAALLLWSGDLPSYESYTEGWVKRYRDVNDPLIPDRVSKCYFAAPREKDEALEALAAELAGRTIPPGTPGWIAPWFVLCRGMADYRTGKHEEAMHTLVAALKGNAACRGAAWAYSAMASFQLGDVETARKHLERSRTANEPILGPGEGDLGSSWQNRVFALLALKEAETLINSEDGSRP